MTSISNRLIWVLMAASLSATLFGAEKTAGNGILVGAYYYPWYQSSKKIIGLPIQQSNWSSAIRTHLTPEQAPMLGLYDSHDSEVISAHIDQSLRGNIDFWAVSWWGPKSKTDDVFREDILTNPNASKLKYAILYECTGRLGNLLKPGYMNFLSDMKYAAEKYFDNPNYLRINNRPVVFIYLSREYFRSKAEDQIENLRKMYPDIYIIGDEVFGRYYRSQYAQQFDAVTAYDVYGQSLQEKGSTPEAIDLLVQIYSEAKTAANLVGTGFVPAVTPGFNDKAVRKEHTPAERYFRTDKEAKEGEVFRTMIKKAGLPYLDPLAGNMMMVTSFNEWFEDTQIEATAGTSATTSQDDSNSESSYTKRRLYADYGYLYLDMLSELTSAKKEIEIKK